MKKMLFFIIVFVMGVVIMPNVYAQDVECKEGDLNSTISSASEGDTIKLTSECTVSSMIELQNKNITIDLNGHTVKRTDGNTIFYVNGGNVTFKDSSNGKGKIEKDNGAGIYVGANSKVTLENININGKYGVVLIGDKPEVDIKGGTITATSFAVSGNGSGTTNSHITISGGNLTSTGTAAIYQPQSGTLNVTGGNITGQIGIVARQGDIKVTGGTITANGTDGQKASVGDAKAADGQPVQLPLGTAIVVDNTESAYADNATVNITGGKFETTASPVVSFDNNKNDITILGGTFNQPINAMFLAEGLIQREDGTVVDPTAITTETLAEEANPNTSDTNIYLLLSLIAVSGCGIAYTIKRRYN